MIPKWWLHLEYKANTCLMQCMVMWNNNTAYYMLVIAFHYLLLHCQPQGSQNLFNTAIHILPFRHLQPRASLLLLTQTAGQWERSDRRGSTQTYGTGSNPRNSVDGGNLCTGPEEECWCCATQRQHGPRGGATTPRNWMMKSPEMSKWGRGFSSILSPFFV